MAESLGQNVILSSVTACCTRCTGTQFETNLAITENDSDRFWCCWVSTTMDGLTNLSLHNAVSVSLEQNFNSGISGAKGMNILYLYI